MTIMANRPIAQRRALVHIDNIQLRNLIHATERPGDVLTVRSDAVVRYNVHSKERSETIGRLSFSPTSLAYDPATGRGDVGAVAVGGHSGEVSVFAIDAYATTRERDRLAHDRTSLHYDPYKTATDTELEEGKITFRSARSIINAVSFAPMGAQNDPSKMYRTQRRLLVSSNDYTVRVYRLLFTKVVGRNTTHIRVVEEACARHNTCINHASVSPDGRLLLTAGDTPHLHLHALPYTSFGSTDFLSVTEGLSTLKTRTLLETRSYQPKPIFVIPTSGLNPSVDYWHAGVGGQSSQEAIFSTAFSSDGLKVAAGSQDGIVQVWDIRSLKRRLAHFKTGPESDFGQFWSKPYPDEGNVDPGRGCLGKFWGIRSLRFASSSSYGLGGERRELLVFSEHQSSVHLVDARTFSTDPDSFRSLHLPDIVKKYPISAYDATQASLAAQTVDGQGRKRKRGGSEVDGDGERKRRGQTSRMESTIPALRRSLAMGLADDAAQEYEGLRLGGDVSVLRNRWARVSRSVLPTPSSARNDATLGYSRDWNPIDDVLLDLHGRLGTRSPRGLRVDNSVGDEFSTLRMRRSAVARRLSSLLDGLSQSERSRDITPAPVALLNDPRITAAERLAELRAVQDALLSVGVEESSDLDEEEEMEMDPLFENEPTQIRDASREDAGQTHTDEEVDIGWIWPDENSNSPRIPLMDLFPGLVGSSTGPDTFDIVDVAQSPSIESLPDFVETSDAPVIDVTSPTPQEEDMSLSRQDEMSETRTFDRLWPNPSPLPTSGGLRVVQNLLRPPVDPSNAATHNFLSSTSARLRPFSSRAYGGAPISIGARSPYPREFAKYHIDDSDDEEFLDRPLDVAGITLGLPGTASEGTLIIAAALQTPDGQDKLHRTRLLQFDLGSRCDDSEIGTCAAGEGRYARRRFAQGGFQ